MFFEEGFERANLDEVARRAGLAKGTIYKHFDSKDALVLELLRQQDAFLRSTFAQMVRERGGEDPVAQLRSLFDVVEQIVGTETFQGCFFVNVAMEFPPAHHPAHVAAARNKAAIEDFVTAIAARARADDPVALAR